MHHSTHRDPVHPPRRSQARTAGRTSARTRERALAAKKIESAGESGAENYEFSCSERLKFLHLDTNFLLLNCVFFLRRAEIRNSDFGMGGNQLSEKVVCIQLSPTSCRRKLYTYNFLRHLVSGTPEIEISDFRPSRQKKRYQNQKNEYPGAEISGAPNIKTHNFQSRSRHRIQFFCLRVHARASDPTRVQLCGRDRDGCCGAVSVR